jgi:hypothetical protein
MPRYLNSTKDIVIRESIVSLLTSMTPYLQIVKVLAEKYDLKRKTAERMITSARKSIAEAYKMTVKDKDGIVGAHIAIRERLYADAEKTSDKLEILKDIARLQGLYTTTIDVQHRVIPREVDDTQLIRLLVDNNRDNVYIQEQEHGDVPDPAAGGVGGNGQVDECISRLTKSDNESISSLPLAKSASESNLPPEKPSDWVLTEFNTPIREE